MPILLGNQTAERWDTMRTKTATVWEDGAQGTAALAGGPRLDTPAWFAWLDAHTTRSFAYPIYNAPQGYIAAFMTVCKEQRRRGGAYWTAHSHVGRRLRKVYVGRSPELTPERLGPSPRPCWSASWPRSRRRRKVRRLLEARYNGHRRGDSLCHTQLLPRIGVVWLDGSRSSRADHTAHTPRRPRRRSAAGR